MRTSAAVVAIVLVLCVSPAAADDHLVNETLTATPDGDGTTNLTDDPVADTLTGTPTVTVAADPTVDATVGAVGDGVGSTVDAVGDDIAATVDGTLTTLDGTVDSLVSADDGTLRDGGRDLGAVDATLESSTLAEGGTAGESGADGEAAPALTTAASDGGGGGGGVAASVAPPGAHPDDAASGGSVPAAVGAGALAVGLAARGELLVGGASNLPSGGVADRLRAGVDRLLRWLVPLRYSKYDGSDPLQHEDRARLLDVIESQPGTYLTAVAEETDLPMSTARHHLRILEREGLVERATLRGKRRLFPAHAESQALAAALADEATAAVLEALARIGPCSTSELAEELDRDPSTMSHHLQRLAADDLVVRERDGRAQVASLAPEVAEVLAAERPEAPASSSASAAD